MGGREMDIFMNYLPSCQTTEYTISYNAYACSDDRI